jgi:hypothetical protein
MTVRIYRSSDASAPVLTGQVGKLTDLLDACLVNGYGAKTAAGWTIAFTTTNKRAYQQNTTGSNNPTGMCLYVDDTGPGAGAAKEARVCGFETMSAITPTGTGQFPTSAQSAIGVGTLVVRKSNTADATARPWTLIANGQTIYLFIESGDNVNPALGTTTFVFGDFKPYKTGDVYAVCIIGRTAENTASSSNDPLHAFGMPPGSTVNYTLTNTMYGHFIARHWTGVGGSIKCGKVIDISKFLLIGNASNNPGMWSSDASLVANGGNYAIGRATSLAWPAPNGPDGALWLSPLYLNHSSAIRGYLPGLWAPLHDRPIGHNDTFTIAAGNLNGKSMVGQNIQAFIGGSANADYGLILGEYSDTWT